MNSSSGHQELAGLLFDWESGELDQVGIDRVRYLLRSDESARAYYVEHQLIGAALQFDAEAGLNAAEVAPGSTGRKKNSRSRITGLLAIAATGLVLCGLASGVLFQMFFGENVVAVGPGGSGQRGAKSPEVTSSGVALVTRLVDVEFARPNAGFDVGDALSTGKFNIQSGLAQIEFFCGATLVIEGPAEFELKSASLARVFSGRMRAQVPPAARGFSLEVNDMKVVDLGTEFGVSVSGGVADIQVFDGEVELILPAAGKRLITSGKSIRQNASGEFEPGQVTPDQFVDIAAIKSRSDGRREERFKVWQSHSDLLSGDPRLVAYYSFDEKGDRKLHSSLQPDDDELDGAIVGARRVEGRWPAKSALEFKRPGDRVRVQIPGEYSSLTFACWARIDSLDRWYNSLFLTDGYNQGEPHWQILDTGQLFFSVRHKRDGSGGKEFKGPTHQEIVSPTFWNPSMSGRWIHLATTYNANDGTITHFLDGEMLHQEKLPANLVVEKTRIGAASIGNWSIPLKPDAEYAVRNLNGSIDEFIIMSSALSAEEVKEIYENGKP